MGVVIGAPLSALITIEAANIWGKLFGAYFLYWINVIELNQIWIVITVF